MELDAYLRRIAYARPLAADLATLNALSLAHVQAIPFENLDVVLGKSIRLEPDSVDKKLIHDRRGGYCFEQNSLFLRVLQQLGFDAKAISARVRYQRPREFTPPRTHVFLRVELDSISWLADVGVGGLSLTGALRLDSRGEQQTPHEPRRILFEEGRYFHQVQFGDGWHDVCEFTLEEMPEIDRELGNWFTSTHPQSHFKNRLMAARATAGGGRVALLNRELTIRNGDHTERRGVESPDALLDVLAEHFGLHFPSGTRFPCEGLDWDG